MHCVHARLESKARERFSREGHEGPGYLRLPGVHTGPVFLYQFLPCPPPECPGRQVLLISGWRSLVVPAWHLCFFYDAHYLESRVPSASETASLCPQPKPSTPRGTLRQRAARRQIQLWDSCGVLIVHCVKVHQESQNCFYVCMHICIPLFTFRQAPVGLKLFFRSG